MCARVCVFVCVRACVRRSSLLYVFAQKLTGGQTMAPPDVMYGAQGFISRHLYVAQSQDKTLFSF